jgi:hypothetical protein
VHVVLYDASWELYEKLLKEVGEQNLTSLAFPFLRPAVMERFVAMLGETDETTIVRCGATG